MTKLRQVYKCLVCGNMVEILHSGAGQLVCCGQLMEFLPEKTKDEGLEKHQPVLKKTSKGIKVKVGSVLHPMEKAHFIEWIELIVDSQVFRQFLSPNDQPEAEFKIKTNSLAKIKAREYCSLHGLWRS